MQQIDFEQEFTLEIGKGTPYDRSISYGWVNTALDAVQQPSAIHAQNGYSVTCDNLSLMMSTATRKD